MDNIPPINPVQSRVYGSVTGAAKNTLTCGNDLMTGIQFWYGSTIDGVTGYYCKPPSAISSAGDGTFKSVKIGNTSSDRWTLKCPAGSALSTVSVGEGTYKNATRPRSLNFTCKPATAPATDKVTDSSGTHGGMSTNNTVTMAPYRFINSMDVYSAGQYVDGISFGSADYSLAMDASTDPRATVQCCTGARSDGCSQVTAGSATCGAKLKSICTVPGGLDIPECKTWCNSNPGLCDNAVIAWCKGKNDPYCNCVNSKASGLNVNPACYDADCMRTGYLTSNMRSVKCPSIVTCTIQSTLANSGVQLSTAIPIEQNCGNSPLEPTSSPADVSTQPAMVDGVSGTTTTVTGGNSSGATGTTYTGTAGSGAAGAASSVSWLLIFIFAVVVFIAVAAGVFMVVRGRARGSVAAVAPV